MNHRSLALALAASLSTLAGCADHFTSYTTAYQPTSNALVAYTAMGGSSANDVWAIGVDDATGSSCAEATGHMFVQHYDGSRWDSPAHFPHASAVLAVSSTGPNDAWVAAQECGVQTPDDRVMALYHWDGSGWTNMLGPSSQRSAIRDVSARAANDAWAVGEVDFVDGSESPVVMHWNGTSWENADDSTLQGVALTGVYAAGQNDVWAISVTRAFHYDGAHWAEVQTGANLLTQIRGAGDAVFLLAEDTVYRWDGSAFSQTLGGKSEHPILAISVSSAQDIWATTGDVSESYCGHSLNTLEPCSVAPDAAVMHWNGAGWSVTRTRDHQAYSSLYSAGDGQVWLAGTTIDEIH